MGVVGQLVRSDAAGEGMDRPMESVQLVTTSGIPFSVAVATLISFPFVSSIREGYKRRNCAPEPWIAVQRAGDPPETGVTGPIRIDGYKIGVVAVYKLRRKLKASCIGRLPISGA